VDDMPQNAALRDGPASGNATISSLASPNSTLAFWCSLFADGSSFPSVTLIRCMGNKSLASNLGLDSYIRGNLLVERRIAEERDVITALAIVLTLDSEGLSSLLSGVKTVKTT